MTKLIGKAKKGKPTAIEGLLFQKVAQSDDFCHQNKHTHICLHFDPFGGIKEKPTACNIIPHRLAHGQQLDKAEKWSVETLEGITKSALRLMCPLGQLKWAGHSKCLYHGLVLVLDFLPLSSDITCNFSAYTISWTCNSGLKVFVGH